MLTDAKIKSLKPKSKQYKKSDSLGLYILVHSNGSLYWRLKYYLDKKEKVYSIGTYPQVSLLEAREERDRVKKLIKQGIDPVQTRANDKRENLIKSNNSFMSVAIKWHNSAKADWKERHAARVLRTLEINIFPYIGHRPVSEILATELIEVLNKMQSRGSLVQLQKIRQRCDKVFQYAIANGIAENNPATNIKGAFDKPVRKNFNSIPIEEVPELIQAISNYRGDITTTHGIKLVLFTALRTNELRWLTYDEVDFENRLITIPKNRVKMNRPHLVPLSTGAVETLRELQKVTGQYKYVFASRTQPKIKPISENSWLFGLYRMGFKGRLVTHGIRSIFSTWAYESNYRSEHIETCLNHEEPNAVKKAYNKAKYLPQRAQILQDWCDFLNNSIGKIIPIGRSKKQS